MTLTSYIGIIGLLNIPIFSVASAQESIIGRTDRNLSEVALTTKSFGIGPSGTARFGKLFSYAFDGSTYAQPLLVPHVTMKSGEQRNVLYIATTNDVVYALDASNPSVANGLIWSRRLTVSQDEFPLPAVRTHGTTIQTVRGNVGILSTPVVDTARNAIYVVASTMSSKEERDEDVSWRLHALDLSTGQEKFGGPVTIAGRFDTGRKRYIFNPGTQLNRASLAIAASKVIVAWASLDDNLQYHGWVMSYSADDLRKSPDIFCTSCGKDTQPLFGASIWQSGRPPAVVRGRDGSESVLFFTSNGWTRGKGNNGDFRSACDLHATTPRPDAYYANSLIRLDPAHGLALMGIWSPEGYHGSTQHHGADVWCKLDYYDYDLGGSGPVLIDDPFVKDGISNDILIGGGKDGVLRAFVITDPKQNKITETDVICIGNPCLPDDSGPGEDHHIMAGPIYWKGKGRVFLSRENMPIRAFLSPKSQSQTPVADDKESETSPRRNMIGHPGAMLFLSANGTDPDSGIIWYTYPPGNSAIFDQGAAHCTLRGILVAVRAMDLNQELWASDNRQTDEIGYFAKFNPPLVADGRVYVAAFPPDDTPFKSCRPSTVKNEASGSGYVHVFGRDPPSRPPVYKISVAPQD